MSRSWMLVCCVALSLIGFIVYTDMQAAKAAAVQAEIQKQQLRIAQEEAERQRKAEAERQLQKKLDENAAYYNTLRQVALTRQQMELESWKSEQMRKQQDYLAKQAGVSFNR